MQLELLNEISVIYQNDKKKILLVRDEIAHVYYVKKILYDVSSITMYQQLIAAPHPHIAQIFDVQQFDQNVVIIEEFINGETLEYMLSKGSMSEKMIHLLMGQLLHAIHHIHALNPPVIHRDIKPGNIMICNGQLKLIDFEIARNYDARKSKDTSVLGSIGFAAPEQFGFQQCDARTDIYAFGAVLQLISTSSVNSTRYKDVIKTCMQLDPEQRYQTIAEILDLFEHKPASLKGMLKTIPGIKQEAWTQRFLYFCIYIFIIVMVASLEFDQTVQVNILGYRIVIAFIIALMLWVYKNVGNIQQITPLYDSPNVVVRFLNGCFIWFLLTFIILFTFAVTSSLLESML